MKKNKKILLLIVFAIALVGLSVGGTIAWLTAKATKVNTFTVGSFEKPTTNPDGTPNEDADYLEEPSWVATEEHKLVPSATFAKDPYVGIGAGSEDAVVYVYVDNTISNDVYFTINDGWEAVEDSTVAGSKAGTYTSGLFKYKAGLTGSDADAWTETALFDEIEVAATAVEFTANASEEYNVTVGAFIHQAKDSEGNEIDADTILNAAKSTLIS